MSKEYDVVVWGASGFTGRLVAEYLYHQYGVGKTLRWAMAGRNLEKLEQVRSSIGAVGAPLEIADSKDRPSLDVLVSKTKVVATTVGPYALYGDDLVAACVEKGIHYCDLSGEVQWMRRVIDQHHEKAKETGAKIVHSCGFDSIPSDMGVFFLQREIHKISGQYCDQIKMLVKAMKGGASGGTIASLNNVTLEAAKNPDIARIIYHPYSLNPRNEMEGPDGIDKATASYEKALKTWTAPFVMALINTRIVRRSHALLGLPFGDSFRYEEAIQTGDNLNGRIKASGIAIGLKAVLGGNPGSFLKKMINSFLPDPGEGPSARERKEGFFNIDFYGYKDGAVVIKCKVKGDRDPGYGSTCKMLGESAVCLALDELVSQGGVLTPSVAMGEHLLNRLEENAGLSFEIRRG